MWSKERSREVRVQLQMLNIALCSICISLKNNVSVKDLNIKKHHRTSSCTENDWSCGKWKETDRSPLITFAVSGSLSWNRRQQIIQGRFKCNVCWHLILLWLPQAFMALSALHQNNNKKVSTLWTVVQLYLNKITHWKFPTVQ